MSHEMQHHALENSTMHLKTTKPKATTATDADSVTSSVTLSESNLQILLTRLTQALNMQNNTNTNNSKEPTGSQNTGSQK